MGPGVGGFDGQVFALSQAGFILTVNCETAASVFHDLFKDPIIIDEQRPEGGAEKDFNSRAVRQFFELTQLR
jgi:hypothetical protein